MIYSRAPEHLIELHHQIIYEGKEVNSRVRFIDLESEWDGSYCTVKDQAGAAMWEYVCKNTLQGPWKEEAYWQCSYRTGRRNSSKTYYAVPDLESWLELKPMMRQLGSKVVAHVRVRTIYYKASSNQRERPVTDYGLPVSSEDNESKDSTRDGDSSESRAPPPKRPRYGSGVKPQAQSNVMRIVPVPSRPPPPPPESKVALIQPSERASSIHPTEISDTDIILSSFETYLRHKTSRGDWEDIGRAIEIMDQNEIAPEQLRSLTIEQIRFIGIPFSTYLRMRRHVFDWKELWQRHGAAILARRRVKAIHITV
ncbi:hypothetical protein F5884DRAFT_502890 [Xylogone sp. PMI_703]|nr:hypothetical protein F5884DRAFT_502890 [Xylogone sp. PMI_703]